MALRIRTPRGDDYSDYTARMKLGTDEARVRAGERGELLRHELGDRMFDLLTEYFPEEYQQRRRREMARAFGVGVAAGFLGRELARMWRR